MTKAGMFSTRGNVKSIDEAVKTYFRSVNEFEKYYPRNKIDSFPINLMVTEINKRIVLLNMITESTGEWKTSRLAEDKGKENLKTNERQGGIRSLNRPVRSTVKTLDGRRVCTTNDERKEL